MGYTYNQPTQVTMDNISAKLTAVEAKVVRLLGKYYIYTHRWIDTFPIVNSSGCLQKPGALLN
jgi:hypothetical protein